MNPIKFKEATIELKKPSSMTDEECGSLFIHQTEDGVCISLWSTSFWQRLKFLFPGKIWLGVYFGKSQPPVWLDCTKTIFTKPLKQK